MLNKEEKEAIEILKKLQKKTPYIIWGDGTPYNKSNQIQTILNLIEKLQKEIKYQRQQKKYWKDNFYKQQKEIEELKLDLEEMVKSNNHKNENWVHKNILNSYISRDKVKEKLNYFEHSFDYDDNGESYELVMEVLDELLEEN